MEDTMIPQTTAKETTQPTYLEILAHLGMTRHLGGWRSTRELATLCRIEKGENLLDVGCGVGRTSAWYAKHCGCRVVGVDLSPRMVEWAKETARREGVLGQMEFKAADASRLPFDDATFDAVICESVLGFVTDKADALREFIRVCKTGGYVGLNESTWLAAPVPDEIVRFLEMGGFSGAQLITVDEWSDILDSSGLQEVVMKTYHTSAQGDVVDRVRWFGITGLLRNIVHMRAYSAASLANRKTLTHYMTLSRRIPQNYWNFYGYGLYVGKKGPP
jgi:ubiquinone/menaquinone biosynthesis C-methylase UbiE